MDETRVVWHNRGNVWDKIATDWAGGEDWVSERKKRKSLADKTAFVTFALDSTQESEGKRDGKTSRQETAEEIAAS